MKPLSPFSAYLHTLIRKDGRTISDIAKEEGVVASTLYSYSSGRRFPDGAGVARLLKALRLPETHSPTWNAYRAHCIAMGKVEVGNG